MARPRLSLFIVLFVIVGGLLLLFFSYPIAVLLLVGSSGLEEALRVRSFELALLVTIITSTIAAVASVIFGVPLAYLMSRYNFRGKSLVESLIDLPIAIPHIIVGVMIVLAFSWYVGLGPIFHRLHINVVDTILGAAMAVTYVSATYSVRVVESAINMLDPELELTAMSLGASRARTFVSVVLPKIRRSIAGGALTSWARAASEAGALFIVAYEVCLGKSLVYPAPVAIYEAYVGIGIIEAAKFSAAMLVVVLGIFVLARILLEARRGSRAGLGAQA
ncbi:ABC transporter permease [Acidilobus sp.]|uniref:ABC transporter permease n=1 Tax=Acidilobus sp. TaxID=1872109 RepID=UPI003D01B54E